MPKKFYITTPIYYPSGNLHIGHAYTTTLADILKRYKKLDGYETYFLTGSDEHGQKIEQKAEEENLTPMEYLKDKVESFKTLWNLLYIDYDKFIRTTDVYHKETVKKIFTKLLEEGYIYEGKYEGFYCVSCEEFLNFDQITEDNRCKISNNAVAVVQEDTYFLQLSKFQNFIENDVLASDFLIPAYRRNEMINSFVKPELKDLSVTRTSFSWGIPINENPKHVVYVWIDALTNYITALGYLQENDNNFKKYWEDKDTEILHLAGKEIIRFHSIYWPAILKGLNLRQPNHLLGHGWILSGGTKMSKSIGNVVDPIEIIQKYGADGFRFYIAYELPTEKDGNFTEDLFVESYNAHLANNVGNLISRTNQMITKYFEGKLNHSVIKMNSVVEQEVISTINNYKKLMDEYKISEATRVVLDLGKTLNKYIEEQTPWTLAKEERFEELEKVLITLQKAIVVVILLLKPILVENSDKMFNDMGVSNKQIEIINFDNILEIKFKKIESKQILFNRIK
ncbi:methionyl-tRNA synthetase [Entomoplasma ellychniae]|uniref:Methionine--tRNA ligase n=1 Tax=Entomoplasma ellychniae TaxID=2114 RepID=A0A8E2QYW2_9MOLU|nr:methionine--tRNA ligase [Entomoplasma ellychniae]PPE04824.1 methionyl-tRNA synthetase [Entomoplasma ellychniae]